MWQVQRKAQKEELVAALEGRLAQPPVALPVSPPGCGTGAAGLTGRHWQADGRMEGLEYRKVVVDGTFDHSGEVLLG